MAARNNRGGGKARKDPRISRNRHIAAAPLPSPTTPATPAAAGTATKEASTQGSGTGPVTGQ